MTLSPFSALIGIACTRAVPADRLELAADLVEDLAIVFDQVHLVDRQGEFVDAEQLRDPWRAGASAP